MNEIGKYLIGIAAAAFICGIFKQLAEKLGSSGKILTIITGIFMLIALIFPLKGISIPDFKELTASYEADAQLYVQNGQEIADKQLRQYISSAVSSYILEKASELNLSVEVSVELTDAQLPEPNVVHISGAVSPYGKQILSAYIADELNVPEENQIWTLAQ